MGIWKSTQGPTHTLLVQNKWKITLSWRSTQLVYHVNQNQIPDTVWHNGSPRVHSWSSQVGTCKFNTSELDHYALVAGTFTCRSTILYILPHTYRHNAHLCHWQLSKLLLSNAGNNSHVHVYSHFLHVHIISQMTLHSSGPKTVSKATTLNSLTYS